MPSDNPSPHQSTPDPSEPTAAPTPGTVVGGPAVGSSANSPHPPENHPKSGRFGRWLVVGLVVIVAAAVVVFLETNGKLPSSNTSAKRDIPVLTYGIASAEIPQYPLTGSDTTSDLQIDAQLFEGLVRYQDQSQIVPQLATSWSNPNDSTWIFNLRHGVTFHSGRTMTAADVKYTLDYAVAHQNDIDGSVLALASSIKQVDVVNDYQVKIVTNGPDPVLLNRLAFLGIIDSKATVGDRNAGTGPYTIKPGTSPSNSSIDLTAYNNYWGGHVYTREVDITLNPNSDQLAAAANNGQLDLAGDFTTKQLSTIHNYQSIAVPDVGISFLGLNTEKSGSPLSSLPARQAAAYALNVPAILQAASLKGVQASQLIPTTIPGHDPSITNQPYDPAKAKQLLAGVTNASQPLTLAYPPNDAAQATAIATQLKAVGFNVQTSQAANLGALIPEALGGKVDMYFLTYDSSTLDGLDILSSLLQGNADYNNTQINTLATQAGTTLDPASRIKLLQQIAEIANQELPDIPVYNATRAYALTKPYHLNLNLPSSDTGTYFWQVYQN